MGLSLARDYSRGTVLGEESDGDGKGSNKWWNKRENTPTATVEVTAEPTPTATPTEVTVTPTAITTQAPVQTTPTATPTEVTVTPTATPATSGESSSATPEESTTQTTTTTSQSSVGETVRTILRQIGLPVRVTPTPAPQPEVITVKEEVINERQVGEILKELETVVGGGVQREVRLRFVRNDGGVGLMAEVRAGQGIPLAAEEAAKISETLRLGSGLKIDRGSDTELVFSRGTAAAATSLSLLIDLDSNTLMVETSLGIKSVAVLPDTAVARALAAGTLTAVNPEQIELIERDDGKIAYRMSGQIGRKLFGFFDIKAEETVDVSAESGRVLPSLTDSLGATLFNLVAPQAR